MAKQKKKKIMDVNEGGSHLVVIRTESDMYNPFHVYLVISPTGAPVRKRLLIKYGDLVSCIYFLRDFYVEALNTMCYSEMRDWIRQRTA